MNNARRAVQLLDLCRQTIIYETMDDLVAGLKALASDPAVSVVCPFPALLLSRPVG